MYTKVILFFLIFILSCSNNSTTSNGNETTHHYVSLKNAQELQKYLSYDKNKHFVSAHRGGPMAGYPENAIETFENALTYAPCILEFDVSKTSDGHLVLMHDDNLDRTTDATGPIANRTLKELENVHLKDNDGKVTSFKIPTFENVLNWGKDKAIMSIDVKRGIEPKEIVAMVHKTNTVSQCIIIVYNWEMLKEYHKLDPNLMISASAQTVENVNKTLEQGVPAKNLLVFVGVSEPDLEVYSILHQKGIKAILGTMHNLDNSAAKKGTKVYIDLLKNGADILATDNVVLAAQAIAEYGSK